MESRTIVPLHDQGKDLSCNACCSCAYCQSTLAVSSARVSAYVRKRLLRSRRAWLTLSVAGCVDRFTA